MEQRKESSFDNDIRRNKRKNYHISGNINNLKRKKTVEMKEETTPLKSNNFWKIFALMKAISSK